MPTSFYGTRNNVATTVATAYTAGAGSLVVANGSGFLYTDGSTPSATKPILVSTFLADGTPEGIYRCEGRSGNTLTLTSLLSGTDASLPTGSLVEMRWCAEHVGQLDTAINALEAGGGGGSGTVTSVAMTMPGTIFSATVSGSPVTTSGTLAPTLATQAANQVLAGPTSGGAVAPTFRALIAADLPNTAVSPGAYTSANITVDAQGRITAAANGSGGSGTPGGSSGQLQYNNASAFGGTAGVIYAASGTNVVLTAQNVGDKILALHGFNNGTGTVAEWYITTASTELIRGLISKAGYLGVAKTNAEAVAPAGMVTAGGVVNVAYPVHVYGNCGSSADGPIYIQTVMTGVVGCSLSLDTTSDTGKRYNLLVTGTSATPGAGCFTFYNSTDSYYPFTILASGHVNVGRSYFDDVAQLAVKPHAASIIGQVVRQFSSGQTADLWQAGTAATTPLVLFAHDKLGRPYTGNTTPTLAAGAGAGTTPTVSVAGTDVNGVITVTTGSSPTASAVVATLTFSAAYGTAPKTVFLTAAEVNADSLSGVAKVRVDASSISTTKFDLSSGSTGLVASTTYKWNYLVIG